MLSIGKTLMGAGALKKRKTKVSAASRPEFLSMHERESSLDSETRRFMEESDVFLERVDHQIHVMPKQSSEDVKRANKRKWEQACMERFVKNKRHIDPDSFEADHPVVGAISRHGFSFYLFPNAVYNLNLVREFYKNMVLPAPEAEFSSNAEIKSRIWKNKITITPAVIASTMGYRRPGDGELNHHGNEPFDMGRIFQTLYIDPDMTSVPHVPNSFKDGYKLLNHFLCYNLFPRQKENLPDQRSATWMVLPVMVIGAFIPGLKRKYPPGEYLSAVLLVMGLILFTLADAQTSPNFSLTGVGMVSGALVMDALLGNLQEAIFTMNPETTQMEMLFCSTLVGLPFLFLPMFYTGELGKALNSCFEHPYVYGVLVFEAMATFVGQVSVLSLIAVFGAATTAMVTTARKAVTLLLSYLIFSKPLTGQHGSGLLLLSMGIVMKLLPDNKYAKRAPTSSDIPKNEKNINYNEQNRFRIGNGVEEAKEEKRTLV